MLTEQLPEIKWPTTAAISTFQLFMKSSRLIEIIGCQYNIKNQNILWNKGKTTWENLKRNYKDIRVIVLWVGQLKDKMKQNTTYVFVPLQTQ